MRNPFHYLTTLSRNLTLDLAAIIRNLTTLFLDFVPCRFTGHRWYYGSFAYYETTRHCPRCKQVQLPADDALFLHQIERIIDHERRTYGRGCHPQLGVLSCPLEIYGPGPTPTSPYSRTPPRPPKPPTT